MSYYLNTIDSNVHVCYLLLDDYSLFAFVTFLFWVRENDVSSNFHSLLSYEMMPLSLSCFTMSWRRKWSVKAES